MLGEGFHAWTHLYWLKLHYYSQSGLKMNAPDMGHQSIFSIFKVKEKLGEKEYASLLGET